MSIRDIRQDEAVKSFMDSDRRTLINACPRFGKIRVALKILREIRPARILLLAPRTDIFKGWQSEIFDMSYIPLIWENITFTSIKKIDKPYDFVIIDEPHELSVNQQFALSEKLTKYKGPILGLTGTLTDKTKNELYDNLLLDTCYTYSIDQGVEEGILADYQLIIHQVPLEKVESQKFKRMEYARAAADSALAAFFIQLKMINLIQNSKAKSRKTRELIDQYNSERLLVFCGVTEVADNLGIPVYHSKSKEKQIFTDFCSGIGDHLATIKMMQSGITVKPINKGIINYMSGNPEDSAQKICRFIGFEYDNPEKKAEIHIVSSNETFELIRLRTGLSFFNELKIKYL